MRIILIICLFANANMLLAQATSEQRLRLLSYYINKLNTSNVGTRDTVIFKTIDTIYSAFMIKTKTNRYAEFIENVFYGKEMRYSNKYDFYFNNKKQLHTLLIFKTKFKNNDTVYAIRDKFSFGLDRINGKKYILLNYFYQNNYPLDEIVTDTFDYNPVQNMVSHKRGYNLLPLRLRETIK